MAQASSKSERKKFSSGPQERKLVLRGRNLHKIDDLLMGEFEGLVKLDLSNNKLQSMECLSNCRGLKWLSVSENDLRSLKGIEYLSNLTVINASRNKLTSMEEAKGLTQLQALILNDNEIQSISNLNYFSKLNTLVLSRNPLHNVGKSLAKLSSLVKLSVSECQLEKVPLLKKCSLLKELRLAHNKIDRIPKRILKNQQLQIIDLGGNYLETPSDIQVLSYLPCLKNLNFCGNPMCVRKYYKTEISKILPQLQILDWKRLESTSANGHGKRLLQDSQFEVPEIKDGHQVDSQKSKLVKGVGLESLERDVDSIDNRVKENEGEESRGQTGVMQLANKKKKVDSGVVLIKDTLHKSFKSKKGTNVEGDFASIMLDMQNFGEGGVSSWD